MSRAAPSSKLLALVDSDSDELSGLGAKTSRNTAAKPRKMPPAKKGRGRPPAANKVTKPAQKSAARSASGRVAAAFTKAQQNEDGMGLSSKREAVASRRGRKAQDKDENKDEDEDEDVVSAAEEVTSPAKTGTAKSRGRPRAAAAAATKADEPKEVLDSAVKQPVQPAKRGRRAGTKSARSEDSEILETQPQDTMDIDTQADDHFEDLPAPKQPAHQTNRTGGGSDVEAGEVQLRRRLGEMTRKYESLELKYRDLRDIGVKAAERNFDNLKKESEERASTANELIGNLKADLVVQRTLAKEGQQNKKQLDDMETKVASLTTSLAEAKQEIKTLSTRLAASRSAEAAASAKVPGSAVKGGNAAARAIASSDAVQTAQLKEDLYGDLTGLIVRVVKRDSAGHVFDCIQTGRNGTLHFKLEVEMESSGENYEEAHFTYKPQLDSNRDRDLIDMLPDFLVEEITFPRPQAAKFYARVIKSLTERIE